jgi:hypothetical protein
MSRTAQHRRAQSRRDFVGSERDFNPVHILWVRVRGLDESVLELEIRRHDVDVRRR